MLKLSLVSRLRPRSGYDVVAVLATFRVAVADDYLRDNQLLINNQPWGAPRWGSRPQL